MEAREQRVTWVKGLRLRWRWALVVVGLAMMATGCTTSTGGQEPSTTTAPLRLSVTGPFVGEDPYGIVTGMRWLDENVNAMKLRDVDALVLEDSTSRRLRIAVPGSGCAPDVTVSVDGVDPVLELRISITQPVIPAGMNCPAILRAHVFEVELARDVPPESVSIVTTDSR